MDKKVVAVNLVMLTAGIGIGYTAAYFIQKRKYEGFFDEEIESVKNAYAPFRKEGVYATPEGAVNALINQSGELPLGESMSRNKVDKLLIDNGYVPLNTVKDTDPEDEGSTEEVSDPGEGDEDPSDDEGDGEEDDEEEITGDEIVNSIWNNTAALNARPINVVNATTNEDVDKMPDRNPDRPYVITVDQYMTDDTDDDNKVSLLYFEGDDTLVDERETIVPNVEEIVGLGNLHHFGLGSRDRNALYIRNEKLKTDIEVIRDSRTFSEVVLGVKPVKENLPPRKMRDDDQ